MENRSVALASPQTRKYDSRLPRRVGNIQSLNTLILANEEGASTTPHVHNFIKLIKLHPKIIYQLLLIFVI